MVENSSFKPLLAAVLANILWGSTFMASKLVLVKAPPISAVAVRFFLASILFGLCAIIKENDFQFLVFKKNIRDIIILGFFGFAGVYFFQMKALVTIASSQSSAVMLLAPVFTLLLGIYFNKKINKSSVVTITFCLIGALLIYADRYEFNYSKLENQGLLYTLISSIFLGLSVPLTQKIFKTDDQKNKLSAFNLTFYSIICGTSLLVLFAIIENWETNLSFFYDRSFWLWTSYLAFFCTFLAFFFWNWALEKISPTIAAGTMYLKTPVALILGSFFLLEDFGFIFYMGIIIIVVTLFASQFTQTTEKINETNKS